jgi:hypothetical protein
MEKTVVAAVAGAEIVAKVWAEVKNRLESWNDEQQLEWKDICKHYEMFVQEDSKSKTVVNGVVLDSEGGANSAAASQSASHASAFDYVKMLQPSYWEAELQRYGHEGEWRFISFFIQFSCCSFFLLLLLFFQFQGGLPWTWFAKS